MKKTFPQVKRRWFYSLGVVIIAAQVWLACGSLEHTEIPAAQAEGLDELPAQRLVRQSLSAGLEKSGARSGRVILSNRQTGEVLAAVGIHKSGEELSAGQVLSDPKPSWSMAKPALVALALEYGVTTPQSVHDTHRETITSSGQKIVDFAVLGEITTSEVIEKSSNVGAVQIGQLLGLRRIKAGLAKLKLTSLGGAEPQDVSDVAFGRGLEQPLKLLRFYEAIGNDGKLITTSAAGCGLAPETEDVLSPQTSQAMLEMLRRTVQQGTGRQAASDFQAVAGKTGTGPNSAAFIGLMPRLAVWVYLEDGEGLSGGKDAAPLARTILEAVQTANILPDC